MNISFKKVPMKITEIEYGNRNLYFGLLIYNNLKDIMTSYIVSYEDYSFYVIPNSSGLILLNYLIKEKFVELISIEINNNISINAYTCKLTSKTLIELL